METKSLTLSFFKDHGSAYSAIYNLFKKVPDTRAKNKSIPLPDILMSSFAIFALKFPSLLKFEKERIKNKNFSSNLKSLFGVKKIPTDSQMRTVIDNISPSHFHSIIKHLFNIAQRGNLLNDFVFMRKDGKPYYLVAIDGTQYFSSKNINCGCCMVKNHRDDTKTYYHQALAAVLIHPKGNQVLPLAVEEISKQDGSNKNDCESSAFERLIKRLKKDHPRLNIIACGDALYAKGKTVSMLRKHDISYILNVKPKGNSKLFGHVDEYERKQKFCHFINHSKMIGENVKKEMNTTFRYANGVLLDNGKYSKNFKVNFLDCFEETRYKKDKKFFREKTFSWVTDLPLNDENCLKIMRGGRLRWRIENETFKTLKKGGYGLEHNYGHGKKNLSVNSLLMMFLSFMTDQIFEIKNKIFKKAYEVYKYKSYLWEKIRAVYQLVHFSNWSDLFLLLIETWSGEKEFDTS